VQPLGDLGPDASSSSARWSFSASDPDLAGGGGVARSRRRSVDRRTGAEYEMNLEISKPTVDEFTRLDTDAIAACRRARADVAGAGDRLRRVHEAGVRLNEVARTPGIRTSSSGLTRLQVITRAAGISRETANQWKKVGRVSTEVLEDYIADCEHSRREITQTGLLVRAGMLMREDEEEPPYTIRFPGLTGKAYERFAHQLELLRETEFHTQSLSDTVIAAIDRVYRDVLARRSVPAPSQTPDPAGDRAAQEAWLQARRDELRQEKSVCAQ
jgi:hypothetical protein